MSERPPRICWPLLLGHGGCPFARCMSLTTQRPLGRLRASWLPPALSDPGFRFSRGPMTLQAHYDPSRLVLGRLLRAAPKLARCLRRGSWHPGTVWGIPQIRNRLPLLPRLTQSQAESAPFRKARCHSCLSLGQASCHPSSSLSCENVLSPQEARMRTRFPAMSLQVQDQQVPLSQPVCSRGTETAADGDIPIAPRHSPFS